MKKDRVRIQGLRLSTRIGLFETERSIPQLITIDISLKTDLRKAGKTGDIKKTVCYLRLRDEAEELICHRQWTLVEEVAETLASHILNNYSEVDSTEIRVRKHVLSDVEWSGVEIERART